MILKVSGEQSDDAYTLIEMAHPPNIGPALHIHPRAAEAYHVLDGEYLIHYGKKTFLAKPGDFMFITKGGQHNHLSGPKGGRVRVISPAGLENTLQAWLTRLKIGQSHGNWNGV